jgi:hypothetical protein
MLQPPMVSSVINLAAPSLCYKEQLMVSTFLIISTSGVFNDVTFVSSLESLID